MSLASSRFFSTAFLFSMCVPLAPTANFRCILLMYSSFALLCRSTSTIWRDLRSRQLRRRAKGREKHDPHRRSAAKGREVNSCTHSVSDLRRYAWHSFSHASIEVFSPRMICSLSPILPSRRRDCHFADTPSPSLLKRLLKAEGVQQNDSLADG